MAKGLGGGRSGGTEPSPARGGEGGGGQAFGKTELSQRQQLYAATPAQPQGREPQDIVPAT